MENGDQGAAEHLLPLVYEELRATARGVFRRNPQHTLQPTVLVHEAFARLIGTGRSYESRVHFLSVAAMAMRQLLSSYARDRAAVKRGGNQQRVELEHVQPAGSDHAIDLIALDEALRGLEAKHPRMARIVDLRFFAGMSIEETAQVVGVSTRTVKLDWQMARAWLSRALSEDR